MLQTLSFSRLSHQFVQLQSSFWKSLVLLGCLLLGSLSSLQAQGNDLTLCAQNIGAVPDVVINTDQFFSTSILNTGFPVDNKNITITANRTLFIDMQARFNNCNFLMGQDAAIVVVSNNTLIAFSSDFYACESMWNGIEVNNGCALRMLNCQVEDAEHAVSLSDGTSSSIANCVFNRNYIGIRNINASSFQPGPMFNVFRGNTFSSTTPLNPPRIGQYGYAGMSWNQTAVAFGQNGQMPNLFTTVHYGILSDQSSVIVENCNFLEIREGGSGVEAQNGSLTMYGFRNNFMEDCALNGIYGDGADLDIQGYLFSGETEVHIASENNFEAEVINIFDNFITIDKEVTQAGVMLQRSLASGGLIAAHNTIIQNELYITGDTEIGTAGIIVDCGVTMAIDQLLIESNFIEIDREGDQTVGIQVGGNTLQNSANIIVDNNEVYFDNKDFAWGRYGLLMFSSANSTGHKLNQNYAFGSNDDYPAQCGIHVENFQNLDVCENEVELTQRGLHFTGSSHNCRVTKNVMGYHAQGLFISDTQGVQGVIGTQTRRQNEWESNPSAYTDAAAKNSATNPGLSTFIVESSAPGVLPNPILPASGWFSVVPGAVNDCHQGRSQSQNDHKHFTVFQQMLLDKVPSEKMIDIPVLNETYYLLLRLKLYPHLLNDNIAVQQFLQNQMGTALDQLSDISLELNQILSITPEQQKQLDEWHALQKQTTKELQILTANMEEEATPQERRQKRQLLKSIQEMHVSRQGLGKAIRANQITQLQDLQQSLDQKQFQQKAEQDLLIIYQKLIQELLNIPFDAQDWSTIRNIAEQNNSVINPAIQKARQMLPLNESRRFLSEHTPEPTHKHEQEQASPKQGLFIAYPNPADHAVQIEIRESFIKELRLTKASGQIVFENKWSTPTANYTLATNHLTNGIYILNIKDELGQIHTKRISVMHR